MTDEYKNLPSRSRPSGELESLQKHGSNAGGLIDQAIARLKEDDLARLRVKAAEEALTIEIQRRTADEHYSAARRDVELHINASKALESERPMSGFKISHDIKTGAGNMRIESKGGTACFVATVAYGDPRHPDVITLRHFRDDILSKSSPGRSFISWYYLNGPAIARLIARSPIWCRVSKALIGSLVALIRFIRD